MRFTAFFVERAAMRRATAPLTIFTIKVAVVPSGYAIEMNAKWSPIIAFAQVQNAIARTFPLSSMSGIISYIGSGFARQASIPVTEGPLTPMELRDHIENRGEKF